MPLPPSSNKIGERIREIRKALKLTQEDFGKALGGLSKSAISKYEAGEAQPPLHALADIVKLGRTVLEGINVEWILYGKVYKAYDSLKKNSGSLQTSEMTRPGVEALPPGYGKSEVYILGGAGSPHELTSAEPVDSIILPSRFIRPNIVPIKICGHSMEPNIFDGAYVGVDQEDRRVISGEIYAVYLPYEGTVVKRIYMATDKVILKSDNRDFPELSIPLEKIDAENFIMGRVKWVLQEF